MGGIGLEPTTSCVSKRCSYHKCLSLLNLYAVFGVKNEKSSGRRLADHWETTHRRLKTYAIFTLSLRSKSGLFRSVLSDNTLLTLGKVLSKGRYPALDHPRWFN